MGIMATINGNGNGMAKAWLSPTTILMSIGLVGGIISITMFYSQAQFIAQNAQASANDLRTLVERQRDIQESLGNRLVKVETTLDLVNTTVTKLNDKLDGKK